MTHGMISAPQPEAVETALDILAAGGNAVDAAIGCALVQTAVDPQMCGIAGFGNIHLYLPDRGVHTSFDFHGRSPLATRADMWEHLIEHEAQDGWGFILKGRVNEFGYGAVTTPRTLAAFAEVLERYGTKSIAELLPPAIEHCEAGVVVRPHMSEFWNLPPTAGRDPNIAMVNKHPATRKIYCHDDGRVLGVGELLRIRIWDKHCAVSPRMASRISIEARSPSGLSRIWRRMVGSFRTKISRPVGRKKNEPLWGTYRGHRIATNHPPGGGVQLVEMLNILENFDLAAIGHNSPEYIRIVAEAMKIATADKDNKVGDPKFYDVPMEELCSKEYAAEMADRIKRGEKTDVVRVNSGGQESKHTTQVSLVDEHGNCVTMTHTLGQPSGVVTDGLGFMYNGAMTVFDPRPGRSGSLAPGKARFSALSPTIVFNGDDPYLVLGAPGATYITMGNLQVMLNVLDFGMSAQEAVIAPRFAALSNILELSNRILRSAERDLRDQGYPILRHPVSYTFAWVHAIRIKDGKWDGGADPATDGMAMEV